ncbi:hypothetical protein BB559_001700 [Furculomyces boomerangus]|uniref:Serine carboxypeptidase S28 n=1 Tax=Furculomyces boomerangus TaxID=61424 RepID=A0A2T9Z179_9FUNG|nr:hypothetical protein BB559_001700 [Furculomyces boomerangus]
MTISHTEKQNRFYGDTNNLLQNHDSINKENLVRYEFEQKIDHFNSLDTRYFNQSFYINDEFYEPGGPIWFVCHGETRSYPELIQKSEKQNFVVELVQETKGMVVLVELRYYGNSTLFSSLEESNIKYFSIDQILEDFATFMKTVDLNKYSKKIQPQKQNQNKWIYFGASFSASLGQWLRIKYPDIVYAAYTSSGSVEAEFDYYQSDITLLSALPCAKGLSSAVKLIDAVFESPMSNSSLVDEATKVSAFPLTKIKIKELFGFENVKNDADFLYLISVLVTQLVQTNEPDDNGNLSNIDTFCKEIDGSKTSLENIFGYAAYVRNKKNEGFEAQESSSIVEEKKKSVKRQVNGLKNDGVSRSLFGFDNSIYGPKPWLYLTCNEIGTFPTSAALHGHPYSSRSTQLSVDYYMDQCTRWFGIDWGNTNLNRTNKVYFGKNATIDRRTLYVEGNLDPTFWSSVVSNVYFEKKNEIDYENGME